MQDKLRPRNTNGRHEANDALMLQNRQYRKRTRVSHSFHASVSEYNSENRSKERRMRRSSDAIRNRSVFAQVHRSATPKRSSKWMNFLRLIRTITTVQQNQGMRIRHPRGGTGKQKTSPRTEFLKWTSAISPSNKRSKRLEPQEIAVLARRKMKPSKRCELSEKTVDPSSDSSITPSKTAFRSCQAQETTNKTSSYREMVGRIRSTPRRRMHLDSRYKKKREGDRSSRVLDPHCPAGARLASQPRRGSRAS